MIVKEGPCPRSVVLAFGDDRQLTIGGESNQPRNIPDLSIGITGFRDVDIAVIIECDAGRKRKAGCDRFNAVALWQGNVQWIHLARAGKGGLAAAIRTSPGKTTDE